MVVASWYASTDVAKDSLLLFQIDVSPLTPCKSTVKDQTDAASKGALKRSKPGLFERVHYSTDASPFHLEQDCSHQQPVFSQDTGGK
jgi:hypothetical protein